MSSRLLRRAGELEDVHGHLSSHEITRVSFWVIEREGIGAAFVLDSDFAATGV